MLNNAWASAFSWQEAASRASRPWSLWVSLQATTSRSVSSPRSGISIDGEGRMGVEDVYAAADITAFPLKQGGLAAQEADAVAERIAAQAGARVLPQPFRPVLRA